MLSLPFRLVDSLLNICEFELFNTKLQYLQMCQPVPVTLTTCAGSTVGTVAIGPHGVCWTKIWRPKSITYVTQNYHVIV
jgi:hypothetical protein